MSCLRLEVGTLFCSWMLICFALEFSKAIAPISTSSCGTSKGCFNTSSLLCYPQVTWALQGDHIHIELGMKLDTAILTQPQWVAMGLNAATKTMFPAFVLGCLFNPSATGQVAVSISFNPGHSNSKMNIPDGLLRNVSVGIIDGGTLVCRFDQLTVPSSGMDKDIYRLDEAYYMLLGCGPANTDNSLKYHGKPFPVVSPDKVNMSTTQAINGTGHTCSAAMPCSKARRMVMAHAMLMLIGWWILLANGIMFARYFKNSFPNLEFFKIKFWFHIHRNTNVIAICLILIAFILVVVMKQVFMTNLKHAMVGFVAVILGFLQPFIATMRCHQGTPHRFIFNWVHRSVGVSAWILASAAILLACLEVGYFQSNSISNFEVICRNIMIGYLAAVAAAAAVLELLTSVETRMITNSVNYSPRDETLKTPSDKITFWKILTVIVFNCFAVALVVTLCVNVYRSDYISPTSKS